MTTLCRLTLGSEDVKRQQKCLSRVAAKLFSSGERSMRESRLDTRFCQSRNPMVKAHLTLGYKTNITASTFLKFTSSHVGEPISRWREHLSSGGWSRARRWAGGGREEGEHLEIQRCGPQPAGQPDTITFRIPFRVGRGSGGAWASTGRRLELGPTTGRPAGNSQRLDHLRQPSVGSVVRETARSMPGSRGGGREPVTGRKCARTPEGGEERPAPRVPLLSPGSGHFGADWPAFLRDLAASACSPRAVRRRWLQGPVLPGDVHPETSCPRSRCGAVAAAGPCLALGRLMRGWSGRSSAGGYSGGPDRWALLRVPLAGRGHPGGWCGKACWRTQIKPLVRLLLPSAPLLGRLCQVPSLAEDELTGVCAGRSFTRQTSKEISSIRVM